jgi:hypothetical protein
MRQDSVNSARKSKCLDENHHGNFADFARESSHADAADRPQPKNFTLASPPFDKEIEMSSVTDVFVIAFRVLRTIIGEISSQGPRAGFATNTFEAEYGQHRMEARLKWRIGILPS